MRDRRLVFFHGFVPESPEFGDTHTGIAMNADNGELQETVATMRSYYHATPKWRLLRRYTLGVHLALLELSLYCYLCGRYNRQ